MHITYMYILSRREKNVSYFFKKTIIFNVIKIKALFDWLNSRVYMTLQNQITTECNNSNKNIVVDLSIRQQPIPLEILFFTTAIQGKMSH